ncbi:putative RNA-dependent RNA polymerase [Cronartium ribicola totivirus 1]|nr:putative RNA-dependent RNA polymerase [Cronartium ribicola totivirus 1]
MHPLLDQPPRPAFGGVATNRPSQYIRAAEHHRSRGSVARCHCSAPPHDAGGNADTVQQYKSNTTTLGLAKQQITLLTVWNTAPFSSHESQFLRLNAKTEEHSAVSWIVWWRSTAALRAAVGLADSSSVLLLSDIEQFKPALDLLRLDTSSEYSRRLLHLLRKLASLAGRDTLEADYQEERERSGPLYAQRLVSDYGYDYKRAFNHYTRLCAVQTIARAGKRLESMSDWWKRRMTNTPSGSSSARKSVQPTQLHHASDRANKRVVWTSLPDAWPAHIMSSTPHCVARCSTKPEAGRKRRALYAACDCSTIVASYASHGLEDAMRWGGMVAKQTPGDVATWLTHSTYHTGQRHAWMSLDYSDYNKEHRNWELLLLNHHLAQAWQRQGSTPNHLEKAEAAAWTALSHLNRVAKTSTAVWVPQHGLFSGHRDTARDNTMLHWIYQQIQLDVLEAVMGEHSQPIVSHMCGDDEDTLFAELKHAQAYYGVGQAMGWHFNPRKQMCSADAHEFLQRMYIKGQPTSQSTVAAVVSLVNGNWYKMPIVDYGGKCNALVAHVMECEKRGCDGQLLMDLARRYLNSFFKHRYGVHVNWTQLLAEPTQAQVTVLVQAGSPIPAGTENTLLKKRLRLLDTPGRRAALSSWWPLMEHMPPRERQRALDEVYADTYNTWFASHHNAHAPLPSVMTGKVVKLTPKPRRVVDDKEALELYSHVKRAPNTLTREQAAARLGIPLPLLTRVDLLTASRTGTVQLDGILQLIDTTRLPEALRPLLSGTTSALPWMV